jgi:hypothetical protein
MMILLLSLKNISVEVSGGYKDDTHVDFSNIAR